MHPFPPLARVGVLTLSPQMYYAVTGVNINLHEWPPWWLQIPWPQVLNHALYNHGGLTSKSARMRLLVLLHDIIVSSMKNVPQVLLSYLLLVFLICWARWAGNTKRWYLKHQQDSSRCKGGSSNEMMPEDFQRRTRKMGVAETPSVWRAKERRQSLIFEGSQGTLKP